MEESGTIASPPLSVGSPKVVDCEWSIHVTYGDHIQLRFGRFSLENNGITNYVIVYDGFSKAAREIGRYHGGNLPPHLIESTENNLFLRFHSDKPATTRGFNATYQTKGKLMLT